jgi:hypothetical protein
MLIVVLWVGSVSQKKVFAGQVDVAGADAVVDVEGAAVAGKTPGAASRRHRFLAQLAGTLDEHLAHA